jgi:hypothetical protein
MAARFTPSRWLLVLSLTWLMACDGGGGAATSASATSVVSSATDASAVAAATASAAPKSRFEGAWKGSFAAKKGEVTLPEGVPYPWWTKDEGDDAAGNGEVVLNVAPDGVVDGQVSGALGALQVRGLLDEAGLSAGVVASDAEQGPGMNGVLVGELDKDVTANVLTAELRVSSHDAALVRSAQVKLTKQ